MKYLILNFLFFLGLQGFSQSIIYVDINATGANDGSSWGDAYTDPQDAINAATSMDSIWIARGLYRPQKDRLGNTNPADPRQKTFAIPKNIKVFGGFDGSESSFSERDIHLNITELSGDIGNEGDNSDNSYHVIYMRGGSVLTGEHISNDCLLDGLVITDGNANVTSQQKDLGGGIHLHGAGNNTEVSPTIRNCTFFNNFATSQGGAVVADGTSGGRSFPIIEYCNFEGNGSTNGGGALESFGSFGNPSGSAAVTVSNSRFFNNSGQAAIFSRTALGTDAIILTNCTIAGSNVAIGCVRFSGIVSVELNNSLLAGNNTNLSLGSGVTLVNNSSILISDNPFQDLDGGDLRLVFCAAAVDAGGNSLNSSLIDFSGAARIQNMTIDVGAYEYDPSTTPVLGNIIYVDQNATGCNNGTTWTNAFLDLQDAIINAAKDDEIWVAQGTYIPTVNYGEIPSDPRGRTFLVEKDLKFYGGFVGGETSRSQRNFTANPTILSGVIGNAGNSSDSVYHVVTIRGFSGISAITNDFELDGFTITGGLANQTSEALREDRGAGVYIDGDGVGDEASPTIRNCTFTGNKSYLGGGGLCASGNFNGSSDPIIFNCNFEGNFSNITGSAVWIDGRQGSATAKIYNSRFFNNRGDDGIYRAAIAGRPDGGFVDIDLINCTVAGNFPAGILAYDNGPEPKQYNLRLKNTILFGNVVEIVTYGSYNQFFESSIIGEDPIFLDLAGGDLRISNCSPALNAGDNLLNSTTEDLDGNPRIQNTTIDLGAYESSLVVPPVITGVTKRYVDANTLVCGDGSSWASPLKDLQDALDASAEGDTVWVADGTYYPSKDRLGNDDPANPRDKTFFIGHNIKVFGGFAGGEENLEDRDPRVNEAILSGDLGAAGDINDNAFHVLTVRRSTATVISNDCEISGFTIFGGNANASDYPNDRGSGMFLMGNGANNECSPTISECKILSNRTIFGGAIDAEASSNGLSNPIILNTIFQDNFTNNKGAAFLANAPFEGSSFPSLINCSFFQNSSFSPTAVGVISGFAALDGEIDLTVTNCTVVNNPTAVFSGSQSNNGLLNFTIRNTITFANNRFSGIGTSGTFNNNANNLFEIDPDFVNWPGGDFRLDACSPAINAGDNSFNSTQEDIEGNPRIQSSIIDLGAYESPFENNVREIIYVSAFAIGCENGSNWESAFTSLQDALDIAEDNDTIWVTEGTYLPTKDITGNASPSDPRKLTFRIDKDLKIFGGFAGNETSLQERQPSTSLSILSGNIGDPGLNSDNSYHVIFIQDADFPNNITSECEIDGFVIKDGNANVAQENLDDRGGGIYVAARGNVAGESNKNFATIRNCTFEENISLLGGAAIIADGTSGGDARPTIFNCRFNSNQTTNNGSAIWADAGFGGNATTNIIGSTFYNNQGGLGAIAARSSTEILEVNVINCSFAFNGSAGIHVFGTSGNPSTLNVTNSILFNNPTLTAGEMNIQTSGPVEVVITSSLVGEDPLFTDLAGDFTLQPCSPAVNAGIPSNFLGDKDFLGNDRIQSLAVDIGAIESSFTTELRTNILYVDANSTGCTNLGRSWTNALVDLQDAIDKARPGDSIWIAAGTYIPNRAPGTNVDNTSSTFYITKDIRLYGGFSGNETSFSQRDVAGNPTILSGERGIPEVFGDNSETIIYVHGINQEISNGSIIDGLIIEKSSRGASMLISPQVHPIELDIEHCLFKENSATYKGVVYIDPGSTITINRCAFLNNTDTKRFGTVNIFSSNQFANTSLSISNSLFANNIITGSTPAFNKTAILQVSANSVPINIQLINNTFYNNQAEEDISASPFQSNVNLLLANSIIEKDLNLTAGFNVFEIDNLIGDDPHFTDPSQGDYTLLPCSPGINGGSNFINPTNEDLTGAPRIQQGTIDIGAYESPFISDQVSPNRIYVNPQATGCKTGASWNNPLDNLHDAIDMASDGDTILVAAGTYTPTNNLVGPTTGRDASFFLTKPIEIYGGFSGNEPSTFDFASRDFVNNETILDGNDNFHTVTGFNSINGARVDGFTITGGKADSASPALFQNDRGGGVYVTNSFLKIANCLIKSNVAIMGSGMYGQQSNIDLENSKIELNSSTGPEEIDVLIEGGGLNTKNVEVNN